MPRSGEQDLGKTTIPNVIELFVPGMAKKQRFILGRRLGQGLTADVYLVTDANGKEFALKAVKLDAKDFTAKDRAELLGLLKKEVDILKRLDQLKGLKKEKDSLLILMPYFSGVTPNHKIVQNINPGSGNWEPNVWAQNNKIIKDCFMSLLNLHGKGIVHRDPNSANYIYDPKTDMPEMVDFGLAQTLNKANFLDDYLGFYQKWSKIAELNGDQHFSQTLQNHYIEHIQQSIRENKLKFAFKLLSYAVLSMGLLYGSGGALTARALLWAYCKTITLDFFTDLFIGSYEVPRINETLKKVKGEPALAKDASVKKIIDCCVAALLFWGVMRSYQHPLTLLTKLSELTAENSALSCAFWQSAFNSISALELGNAALFYYPASNTYKCLSDLFERTFGTEERLGQECENMVRYPTWTSYFSSFVSKPSKELPEQEASAPALRPGLG